jgi:hypothetical protein
METTTLCQALLDLIARELPEEHEALLGLAALITFHPDAQRLFLVEAMALLMRHRCAVPSELVREVGLRLSAKPPADALQQSISG